MDRSIKRFVRSNQSKDTGSDIDAARLREIFENAVITIKELLHDPDFGTSISSANKILEEVLNHRIAPPKLTLPLYNSVVNDLILVMDVKKRRLSAVSNRFPDKRALINSALKGVSRG
jgi:hypothetical protein